MKNQEFALRHTPPAQDVSGTLITDSFVPPFVQFNTNPYILPALVAENVSFELSVRTVAIAERSISNATTLSDYFVDVDSMSSPASIEFSQAFAFSVQLVSQATRALWTLRPSFVLMTVFDGPQSGSAGVQNALNPGQMLDESFCGMNRTDQIAAWGLVDVQRAPNVSSAPDALLNAQSWLSSASDALSPGLVTAIEGVLSGSSFSDFTSLQGDILPPKAPSSSAGLAAAVPDGTGGFAVPLRNRLFVDASSAAGYTMMFCSVVTATPYTQLVAFGSFPVYTNKQAAMADSLSVNGAFAPAFGVPGYVLDPKNGDALMYWFPSMPASTSSLICASIDVVGPYVPALVQNVVTIQSPSSPACQSFVKSISGRRRLLTTQKKLEFSALKTPKVKRKVATQYAQLLLGKNSPPTQPLPPLPPPHPPPTASNYTTRLFDKTAIGSAGLSATTLAVIVVTSVVGGVGAILGIVGCFWWCYRKKPHTGAPRFNPKSLRV